MNDQANAVLEVVRAIVEEILEIPGDEVRFGVSLKELGANSLDRVEIVTEVIEELGLDVSMRDLAGLRNIGELVSFLQDKLAA